MSVPAADTIKFRKFPWSEDTKRRRTRYMVLVGCQQPGQVLHIHDDATYPWRATRWLDGGALEKFRTRAEAAHWVITGQYPSQVTA